MIERRNWATRRWGQRPVAGRPTATPDTAAPAGREMPYLWFLLDERSEGLFQRWATAPDTVFVPCFRSEAEASELASKAGAPASQVLGFSALALPDLMTQSSTRLFLVSGVGETGRIEGQYLPLPPAATVRAIRAA